MNIDFRSLISDNKLKFVEPLIISVEEFYGENVNLTFKDDGFSTFERSVLPSSNGKPIPAGAMCLSRTNQIESALVHELLHLSMPLESGVHVVSKLSLEFDPLLALMNNLIEHEVMIKKFLEFGYPISEFINFASVHLNYNSYRAQNLQWWMHEYFRMVITKNHVAPELVSGYENSIKMIKKNAVKYHPDIESNFQEIYVWLKNFRHSKLCDFSTNLCDFVKIFRIGNIDGYLRPNGNCSLEIVQL